MNARNTIRLVALDLLPCEDEPDPSTFGYDVFYHRSAESSRGLTAAATIVTCVVCLSAAEAALVLPNRPSFSSFTNLFPILVPGFDQELGVTVLSRQQPDQLLKTPIHAGAFEITPTLTQGASYDSNVLGFKGGPASAISTTSASLGVYSNWPRDRVGAYVGVDNETFLDTPKLSRTDVTAALGGGLTLGRGEADLAGSHLSLHEDPTTIGALPTSTPVPFTVDDVRLDYKIPFGRLTATPNLEYSQFRYSTTTIGGQVVSQRYRDRDVGQGGVALRYETGEEWSLLGVATALNSHYVHAQPGIIPPNSTSYVAMAGFDYQVTGPFRLRLLAGLEGRSFTSSAYRQRITPVGQLDAVWSPTGLTTVTGTLSRSIEDPAQADVAGLTLTRAQVEVDHELRRDIILRGQAAVGTVDYIQGVNNQYNLSGSIGATWLINQSLQLLGDYQYIWQSGAGTAPVVTVNAAPNSGSFSRNIVAVKLRVAL